MFPEKIISINIFLIFIIFFYIQTRTNDKKYKLDVGLIHKLVYKYFIEINLFIYFL